MTPDERSAAMRAAIQARLDAGAPTDLPGPEVFGCWPPCQRRTLHSQARKDPA